MDHAKLKQIYDNKTKTIILDTPPANNDSSTQGPPIKKRRLTITKTDVIHNESPVVNTTPKTKRCSKRKAKQDNPSLFNKATKMARSKSQPSLTTKTSIVKDEMLYTIGTQRIDSEKEPNQFECVSVNGAIDENVKLVNESAKIHENTSNVIEKLTNDINNADLTKMANMAVRMVDIMESYMGVPDIVKAENEKSNKDRANNKDIKGKVQKETPDNELAVNKAVPKMVDELKAMLRLISGFRTAKAKLIKLNAVLEGHIKNSTSQLHNLESLIVSLSIQIARYYSGDIRKEDAAPVRSLLRQDLTTAAWNHTNKNNKHESVKNKNALRQKPKYSADHFQKMADKLATKGSTSAPE